MATDTSLYDCLNITYTPAIIAPAGSPSIHFALQKYYFMFGICRSFWGHTKNFTRRIRQNIRSVVCFSVREIVLLALNEAQGMIDVGDMFYKLRCQTKHEES